MKDIQQVWESQDGWKALGLRYFVHQDFDQQPDILKAFDLIISARVLGAQIGEVTVAPLANTNPIVMPLIGGIGGSIKGQLDDWQGFMPDGTSAASWTNGGLGSARFLLTLDIDIVVPIPIFGKMPIQVKGFHKPCVLLLHWNVATSRYTYMPS